MTDPLAPSDPSPVGRYPSGWFPDPFDRYDHRWFNGVSWTSDVSDDGRRLVDPLGVTPGTPATVGNRAGTASLVCGLIAVLVAWIPLIVAGGVILAVVAVVLGVNGRRASRTTGVGAGRSTAGIVTGLLGLAVSVIGVLFTVSVFREVLTFIEPGPRLVDDVECVVADDGATVSGTLSNLDDRSRSYVVFATVESGLGYVEVDDLAAGDTTSWQVRVDDVDTTSAGQVCEPVVVVNGPFPFGVETDPYTE